MTAVLDPHPDAGHPAVACLTALTAILDELPPGAGREALRSGDYAEVIALATGSPPGSRR